MCLYAVLIVAGCSGGLVKVWDGKLWQDMLKEETLEPRLFVCLIVCPSVN